MTFPGCAFCGGPVPTRAKPGGKPKLYCGPVCKGRMSDDRRRQERPPTVRVCVECGAPVDTKVGKPVCAEHRADKRDRSQDERRRTLARYGLTEADYAGMINAQGGRCAICRTDSPGGRGERWHIDHDHHTGKVRGLLCNGCNAGIGMLGDNILVALAAYRYLAAHESTHVAAWAEDLRDVARGVPS